ncbi:nucleoside-diphosphate-sugar epimerase [Anoxybacillus voinovskiensis]|uniref:Nucleoside-diphosphate-sugar epimerase n=1 Tax=Anoxybacteroides voinovskiense TaxID=230470 RepID=A0A840DY62_9BACL|nr:NAD-dependent epimerase/dehydratase family protein [Anoxybacillus voinovskiensis]MBB4075467.1 nucleoside-diphosphate-sugar epimerase [Anoxybacillus voinovskiensis]GGJ79522.1 membrane protein [Anoxybacillus voinovskiensis]
MRKAIVLGASGGMGYALVQELAARKMHVKAFARSQGKLQQLFGTMADVEMYTGDVFRQDELIEACKDVDLIFHAVNIPYPEWPKGHPAIMENVLKAAEKNGAKVVFVDNIYAYGRSPGKKVTEDTPKNPHTKKGKIRLHLNNMLKEAHQRGVPTLICHFPDFYGPNAENTLMHFTLNSILSGRKAQYVGRMDVKREFIYTPDGAKAMVELSLRESAYGDSWNIPAHDVISGHEIIEIARRTTGYSKRVSTVGKGMIAFLGLFHQGMKEMVEMMYLNEEPVVLSGEKYEREIGPLPRTPYEEGIQRTIEHMKQKK